MNTPHSTNSNQQRCAQQKKSRTATPQNWASTTEVQSSGLKLGSKQASDDRLQVGAAGASGGGQVVLQMDQENITLDKYQPAMNLTKKKKAPVAVVVDNYHAAGIFWIYFIQAHIISSLAGTCLPTEGRM